MDGMGRQRKPHNNELQSLYRTINIVRVITVVGRACKRNDTYMKV